MMNTAARFTGTKIRSVLDQQGRRQDWLATRLGVSPAAVNRWIHGKRSVDYVTAVRIADVLDVPFSLLFDMPMGIEAMPIGLPVEVA